MLGKSTAARDTIIVIVFVGIVALVTFAFANAIVWEESTPEDRAYTWTCGKLEFILCETPQIRVTGTEYDGLYAVTRVEDQPLAAVRVED